MKNYFSKIIIVIAFVAITALSSLQVHAQTMSMPVFYDVNGNEVNTNNDGSFLQAGTYYRNSNGTGEVFYYGNGRFYDPSTMTYWGSEVNSTGASGVAISNLTPTFAQDNSGVFTPGVPNTGAGGQAVTNWLMLAGVVLALGAVAYGITKQRTV